MGSPYDLSIAIITINEKNHPLLSILNSPRIWLSTVLLGKLLGLPLDMEGAQILVKVQNCSLNAHHLAS